MYTFWSSNRNRNVTLYPRRYGDGYILLGFEAGYITAISTHIKEVGQELLQVKNHRDSLNDIAISQLTSKVVTCGDNNLKIHSLQNLEETEKVISVSGETGVSTVSWSADGSMLAAVTHSGNVLIYLAQIPKLTSVCGNRVAVLVSLTEVAVYMYTLDKVSFACDFYRINSSVIFLYLLLLHCMLKYCFANH